MIFKGGTNFWSIPELYGDALLLINMKLPLAVSHVKFMKIVNLSDCDVKQEYYYQQLWTALKFVQYCLWGLWTSPL